MSSVRTYFKAWAIILLLSASLLVLASPVSGDAEPNDTIASSETTTDFSNVVGNVDIGAGTPDIFDVYSFALTGGAMGDFVTINMSISSLTPPCIMRVLMPTDNGFNFEVVNKTGFMGGTYSLNFNATVTGTYYLEIMGGTFNYDGTDGYIQPGSNPGFNSKDSFSTAEAIQHGDDSGSGQFIDGQNYVDIYSFTTSPGDIVDINFTGSNIGAWEVYLLDDTYSIVTTGVNHGNGFWSCNFQKSATSTYYIALNSGYESLSTGGSYSWTSSIKQPAVNMVPHISNPSITPNTILDNKDVEITFSLDAVDTDGVVMDAEIYCSPLWTGGWKLAPSNGDSWVGQYRILNSNITSLGVFDVEVRVWDDDSEYNNSIIGNITVVEGPVVFPDISVSIGMAEDDEDLYIYLDQYLEDIHKDLQDYTVWQNGYGVVGYFGDIFEASLYNATHVVIHLEEHQYGYDEFTVNVSYTDGSFVHINFFVSVYTVNDIPQWLQFNFIDPEREPIDIIHNETIYIDLDEDIEYRMNITAWDVEDSDNLLYGCNESNNDAFIMDDFGNINFTPAQAYADVGVFRTEMWVYDLRIAGPANTTEVVFYISNVNDAPYGAMLDYHIDDADFDQDGDNNLTVVFTITRPQDEDGETYFTYIFDFGDGSIDEYVVSADEETITIYHTYSGAGSYSVNVTVEDEGGLSCYVQLDNIYVTEPDLEPEIEWWTMFEEDDLEPDPDVEIGFNKAEIRSVIDESDPDIVTFTTSYQFSGTCSDDVVIIYLYQRFDDWDSFYTFYNPNDYTEQAEIEPSAGSWEFVATYVSEMDRETYDAFMEMIEELDIEPEPTTQTYMAVGWTEDARYNYDTIEVTWTSDPLIPEEEPPPAEDPPFIDWDDPGDVTLVSMFALSAVVFIVAISLLIIVIVLKKKRRDREGEEDVGREHSPYERRDDNNFEDDDFDYVDGGGGWDGRGGDTDDPAWYCPRCGTMSIGDQCQECSWVLEDDGTRGWEEEENRYTRERSPFEDERPGEFYGGSTDEWEAPGKYHYDDEQDYEDEEEDEDVF